MTERALIRDIMHPGVTEVSADLTPIEGAELFVKSGIGGAPVRDAQGKIVGIVSARDLLARSEGARSLADVMTRLVFAVRSEDPAIVAVRFMARERVHRLLVLGPEGELAGIVTAFDVIDAIARGVPVLDEGETPVEYVRFPPPPSGGPAQVVIAEARPGVDEPDAG